MLGISSSLVKGGASLLTFVKDNLKLYLDFTSNKSDTLKFPSEGSTEFDGTDDYINFGNDSSVQITGALSISSWIKTDNDSKYMFLVNKNDNTNVCYYSEVFNNGQLFFRIVSGGTNYSVGNTANTQIADGNWHHYCCVFEPSTSLKIYIDGELKETNTTSIPATIDNDTVDLEIGRRGDDSNYFEGKMANTAIWSRVLEPEEIQSIMNKSYSQLKGVEKTSLVAWWALDNVQKVTDNLVSSGLIESETGEILSSNVSSFNSITGAGNNYTNNILEFVANGYAFFNISSLAEGKLYRFTYNVLTQTASGMAHSGGSSVFTGGIPTTVGSHEQYLVAGSANLLVMRSTGFRGTITDIVVQEVSMTGVVTGATTTTSVYGGNAPILPRAVDVAKEGQADNIGNGSALFNGSTDIINFGSDLLLDNIWNGGGTLTAWIFPKSDGEGDDGRIAEKRDDGNGWTFVVREESSGSCKIRLFVNYSTTNGIYTTNADVTINEWNHVAVTYDTSGAGSSYRPTFYINGIVSPLSATTDSAGTADSDANEDFTVGGNKTPLDRCFDGNISQVGLWQGALTQAQIQSVMESTSYQNIPSSVKSTLGSEISGDPTFDNASNWSISLGTGSLDVNTTVVGKLSAVDAQDKRLQKYSILTVGKLYKVTFTIDSYSSGRVRGLFDTAITFTPTGTGTYTRYFVASNTFFLVSFDGTANLTMTDISIKEVTNDIVAYYPLTESKHQAPSGVPVFGAVEDVTTGENLGSELFTGFTNTDCATFNYNSSTKELTATCDGSSQEVHASISIESGKTYRVEFTTGANYSNTVFLRGFKNDTSLEGNASSPDFNRGYFGTNNTYVFYTRATATGTKYIGFRGSSGNTIHITNFSVKKADSNMGLLL